jgi:lipoprotein-releasing system permease protein
MAWAYFRKIWFRSIWGVMIAISVTGIALGVASLVVTLSVMNGFHAEITSKLLSLNPHLLILNPFIENENIEDVGDVLNKTDGIRKYSSFIFAKGLLSYRGKNHGAVIKGVGSNTEQPALQHGSWKDLGDAGIIIGSDIAQQLNVESGDELFLVIPRVENVVAPVIPFVKKLEVCGVFSSGIYEYDSTLSFINIDTARILFSEVSNAGGIEVFIDDPFDAENVAEYLKENLTGRYYSVQTWQERNYNLFAALKLEKAMMYIVLVMIVLVATFNIAGTLIMLTITRSKDCGVMRAIGATKSQIRMMFNFKGLLIGVTGTALGTLIGIILGLLLRKYQFISLPPKVYLISTLPVKFSLTDILFISVTALFVSYLSTIYPAYRAGKMEVAAELRNE